MKDSPPKPLRLRNLVSGVENYDTLHTAQPNDGVCTRTVCNGALMFSRKTSSDPRPKDEVLRLAKEFIDEYYHSIKRSQSEQHRARWEEVQQQIEKNGNTYDLTQTELVYGAKLAWRNAARCIGRIQWSKLQVFDARFVTTASGMFEAILTHIKYATNKGNIRSAITIFQPRTDGKHDFRVWNNQFVTYAGYKEEDGSITGDPSNVEFTEVCLQMGWKGKRTRFEVLPLVLSAYGHDPEWFDIPSHLVLEVKFSHPEYDWFKDLGLQWYALPAVSSMLFDCGGLLFPAAPFNGWYMATEIGARNMGDSSRYNMLEPLAKKMGLDTRSHAGLWKDRALVEMNVAVLHSFQLENVTIVDHHTAAETFMKHYETEQRVRGGCPADWVWIVPPMSGSITPVFHQEMSIYYMRPSYEYQDPAWKTHVWKKNRDRDGSTRNSVKKSKRKFRFKEIARAVKFTSKLFGKALSKRIKATILYATETGKSENYAKRLGEIFGHTFNAQVHCMADYDIINIEHEALVLVVTSTFGNGDPPENGEKFAKTLYSMKVSGAATGAVESSEGLHRSLSFMRMNSLSDVNTPPTPPSVSYSQQLSWSGASEGLTDHDMGPLSNVRYAVFALGSSAYPNYCAFGKYVDTLMGDMGAEKLVQLTCGDELAGQEQQFNAWAKEVFTIGCETFCLDDDAAMRDATAALKAEGSAKSFDVKLAPASKVAPPADGLAQAHGKKVRSVPVVASINLHGENANSSVSPPPSASDSRWTQQVILNVSQSGDALKYQPGDHLAVLPNNRKDLVEAILSKLVGLDDPDKPVKIMAMKESHTPNGTERLWVEHPRLPACSIRQLLTRYCDITTPPSPNFLKLLSAHAQDNAHKEKLDLLASDAHEYEDWKHEHYPHLVEVLEEFPSVELEPALLVSQLPLLQPRFYSISSSPKAQPGELHLTVAVVIYKAQNGQGPLHYGVCSNFLRDVKQGDSLECFVRNASSFHLPKDESCPIILVGPGTGVAPFRGFWQHRLHSLNNSTGKFGDMSLFFGCRTRVLDLYAEEKEQMKKAGVLRHAYLALSREPGIPKTYVQDLLVDAGKDVVRQLVDERGHFYVCGDCTMAECVFQRLKSILIKHSRFNEQDVDNFLIQMRDENRYHEDIFGITLRTEEIHREKRASARSRMTLSQSASAGSFRLEGYLASTPDSGAAAPAHLSSSPSLRRLLLKDDSLQNVDDLMPDTAKPAYSGTSGPASDVHQGRNGARRKRLTRSNGSGSREIVWSDKAKEDKRTGASPVAQAAIATSSLSSSEAVLKDDDDDVEDTAMDNGSDSTDEQTTLVEGQVSPAGSSESPTGPDANHTEQDRSKSTSKTPETSYLAQGGSKDAKMGCSTEHIPLERTDGSNWVPERAKGRPPKHVVHGEVRDSEASFSSRAMSASPRILRAAEPREGLEDPSPCRNHAPASARNTMYASLQSLNRLNFRTEVEIEEPTVMGMSKVLWKKVESKAAGFFSSIARRKE